MDIAEKVYGFMKSSKNKNGFIPTARQMAEEFNVTDQEVKAVIERLEESGKINITDIPGKTTIEFCD